MQRQVESSGDCMGEVKPCIQCVVYKQRLWKLVMQWEEGEEKTAARAWQLYKTFSCSFDTTKPVIHPHSSQFVTYKELPAPFGC